MTILLNTWLVGYRFSKMTSAYLEQKINDLVKDILVITTTSKDAERLFHQLYKFKHKMQQEIQRREIPLQPVDKKAIKNVIDEGFKSNLE